MHPLLFWLCHLQRSSEEGGVRCYNYITVLWLIVPIQPGQALSPTQAQVTAHCQIFQNVSIMATPVSSHNREQQPSKKFYCKYFKAWDILVNFLFSVNLRKYLVGWANVRLHCLKLYSNAMNSLHKCQSCGTERGASGDQARGMVQ